jgi:opacity protein-like surface antigen
MIRHSHVGEICVHSCRRQLWHERGYLEGMSRKLFLLIAAIAALWLSPRHAAAQEYFQQYGLVNSFPVQSGYAIYYSYTPKPRVATHDSRIDPHLLKAARIAESKAPYRRSSMRCWRSVKEALMASGAVSQYPATSYACEAGNELQSRYGFVRLPIHDPYSAPVGSVLVYEGGGAGHVEFRTEHGFASDYRSPWRCKFRLIGVYAKLSA